MNRRTASGVIAALAVLAGIGAVFADAAPTGLAVWDAVLRFLFAAVATAAGSRARRWSWLILTGVGAALAQGLTWVLVAGLGLGLSFGSTFAKRRDQLFGSLAVGLGMQGILRMQSVGFFGLTSLLAAAAVIPTLVLGYRHSRRHVRKFVRRIGGVLFLLSAVIGVITAVGVLAARVDADRGVTSARNGLEAAREGDQPSAITSLDDAEQALSSANETLSAFWMKPGRLLPVVGQHLGALDEVSGQGADIAGVAAEAAKNGDVDALRAVNGSIDLSQLDGMSAPLSELVATLNSAKLSVEDARSPWLLPVLDDQIGELLVEIDDAGPDAQLAAQAVAIVPDLLGQDGPRRYLVLFANPAESRELGGILGSFAEIEADNGALRLIRTGKNLDIRGSEAAAPALVQSPRFTEQFRINEPEIWTQNWTGMPDFPAVAAAARDLYPQMGGGEIDGVMYVDPFAIAAILDLTGPIATEFGTFDSSNVAQFLLNDQYEDFAFVERNDALEVIAKAAFEEFTNIDLPGPRRLGDLLGPVARQGRLMMATANPIENAFLQDVKLLGSIQPASGQDLLGVVQVAAEANKLDTFVYKDWTYDVVIDPETGDYTGTLEVEVRTDIPDGVADYVLGVPDPITNPNDPVPDPLGRTTVQLSVYTPHPADRIVVDGEDREFQPWREFDRFRFFTYMTIAPNTSRTAVFELSGQLVLIDGEYRLDIAAQPTINLDTAVVTIRTTDGSALEPVQGFDAVAGGAVRAEMVVTEDMTLIAKVS